MAIIKQTAEDHPYLSNQDPEAYRRQSQHLPAEFHPMSYQRQVFREQGYDHPEDHYAGFGYQTSGYANEGFEYGEEYYEEVPYDDEDYFYHRDFEYPAQSRQDEGMELSNAIYQPMEAQESYRDQSEFNNNQRGWQDLHNHQLASNRESSLNRQHQQAGFDQDHSQAYRHIRGNNPEVKESKDDQKSIWNLTFWESIQRTQKLQKSLIQSPLATTLSTGDYSLCWRSDPDQLFKYNINSYEGPSFRARIDPVPCQNRDPLLESYLEGNYRLNSLIADKEDLDS